MKGFIATMLLTGLLMQVFSKQLVMAEYMVNKKFISSVLCVNRNVPGSSCHGKCHLKQELAKDETGQQSGESKSKTAPDTVWIPGSVLNIQFTQAYLRTAFMYEENMALPVFSTEIFHPPGLVV